MTHDDLLKIIKETDLFLLIGNSGSGKTKIANYIAEYYNVEIISVDIINKRNPLINARGMSLILNEDFLKLNKKVIIDDHNLTNEIRNPYLIKAYVLGKKSLIIDCGKGSKYEFEELIQNGVNISNKNYEIRKNLYQVPSILHENQKIINKNAFWNLI